MKNCILNSANSFLVYTKKTTNFAVLSELGRFPLHFDIVKAIINFWVRLENLDNFPLLKDAYIHSKRLNTQHKPSWYGSLKQLLQNVPQMKDLNITKFSREAVKKAVKDAYLISWKNQLASSSDGKLRTYTKFKTVQGFEKYLTLISSFELRRSVTKLRVSSHHLEIESGRYRGAPPHQRLCRQCDSGEVEDEIHFLLCCPKYTNERQVIIDNISQSCSNFSTLNIQDKFFWIMNCENAEILRDIGEFIHKHCR